jgi:cobalt-zinc-cadmium efflux system membrane fusion protein
MNHTSLRKPWLLGGAAAVILLGGVGLYSVFGPEPAPAAEESGEEGHEAESGAAEGVVVLTPAQIQAAGIAVVTVAGGGGGETRLSGRVEPMVDARASVAAVIGGRVERVLVAPGQPVRTGQPLAILVSGDAATYRADAEAANASAEAARRAYERDQNLEQAGVVARQDVEASRAQALSAEAAARAARARTAAAGSPSASGRVSVASPINGVVTSVQVGPGGFAAQGSVIAEVTNPARVEIVFNAPPALAAQVSPGVRMNVQGANGEFAAVVTGVAVDASEQSGATIIRARPVDAGLPPAGSAVSGTVVTGALSDGLTVPSESVQTVNGSAVVFVQTADGFRAVPVLIGRQAGDRTEILRGLDGSERIAGANAFLLKAELAKGEAEDED